ncbi:MAG TPA: right-handed parallel beta-helix repeat-containing protein [Candidatus Hydrogenedentes bacterium]|nr:right-handed parallel beta-helix repeat-containing protein [Candidatus Hydrogenedentota bacterium]
MSRGSFSSWTCLISIVFVACSAFLWAQDVDITANTSWPEGAYTHGNITVRSGVTLTLNGVTQITATNITVETGAVISADGTGYGISGGPGGTTNGGGTHGGFGGLNPNATYGSAVAPVDMGSGGEDAQGGGAIRLDVTGTLTVSGSISANGNSVATYGGGAGGSIYVIAGILAGNGTIRANGGQSVAGGGGGRVALHYGTKTFTGAVTAYGGAGTSYSGVNGTVGFFDESNPSQVILQTGHNWRFEQVDSAMSYWNVLLLQSWVVFGNGVDSLQVQNSLDVSNTSTLLLEGTKHIRAAALTIATDSTISADRTGYATGQGPGGTGNGGGTYGGSGGLNTNATYGSAVTPTDMGSGGEDGPGGGAIRLDVTGTLTVAGMITTNGDDSFAPEYGGGAGGSIYITAGTLAGNGVIRADGGDGVAGGGGGRVALHYGTKTFTGAVTAYGGTGSTYSGGNGTVGFFDESNPSKVILQTGHNWRFEQADSAMSYWNVLLLQSWVVFGNGVDSVQVQNSLELSNTSTLLLEGTKHLSSASMTIAASSTISANGTGYAIEGGPGGTSNGGGTYGGRGGVNPDPTYGSAVAPVDMGSGGEDARGGGAIRLDVAETLTVDGLITANGDSVGYYGGGAGGSIYIIAGTLAGSGTIRANGGESVAGGGGGRVALHYRTKSYSGVATASGGAGTSYSGSDGTVKWFHWIPILVDQTLEGDVETGVEQVYVLDWPGGDWTGLVRVTPAETPESWSLLGRYDIPPIAGDTQWTGVGPTIGDPISHVLLALVSTAGRYFFNPQFTLTTSTPHFSISCIGTGEYYAAPMSLGTAGNAGLFSGHIYAMGITSQVRVFLRTDAKTEVCEGAISNITATGFDVTFNLTDIEAGVFDVVILWPDGTETVIESGLTVTDETNTVWYVDHENTGTEDGLSWATAFRTIQPAIDAASTAGGGEVWVAEGNYNEARTHVDGSLEMKEGVYLYGGFVGIAVSGGMETERSQRDWTTHIATIDGSVARGGAAAYHVVVGADNAILDGFTVTGGNASGGDTDTGRGGGLYNPGVSPTVVNCTFTNNTASYAGGGVQNGASNATITNCMFTNNTGKYGGGVENEGDGTFVFRSCTFNGNTASEFGGGMHTANGEVIMDSCTFSSNSATSGGGMQCYTSNSAENTQVTATQCSFENNIATAGTGGGINVGYGNVDVQVVLNNCEMMFNSAPTGGGIYCAGDLGSGSHSQATLTACLLLGNDASTGGGMHAGSLSQVAATNCRFIANTATGNGGGVHNNGGDGTFFNCTFFNNSATGLCGGLFAASGTSSVTNCILWNDTPEEIRGNATVTYSDVQFGYAGTGNLNASPQFMNANEADFHLIETSPCINTGTNDGAPLTDSEGNPRPVDGKTDMGAYEYQGEGGESGGYYCCPTEGTEDGFCVGAGTDHLCAHSADYNPLDRQISVRELIRVAQFHNSGGFHCDAGTEDGYAPGAGDTTCTVHSSDYNPQDWQISVSELLRLKQFHDAGADPTVFSGNVSTNISVTHTVFAYFVPGGTQSITVELSMESTETVTGIALMETLPNGWTFQGIRSGNAPDVLPAEGAGGNICFAKLFSPTVPWSFTYDVLVPDWETVSREIQGQFFFRTNGQEICSPVGKIPITIQPVVEGEGATEGEGEGQTEGEVCGTWDDCVTACAGAPNTDTDHDGLTACVEDCLCTDDGTADSDDDGMPDPFELQNDLDPTVDDAAEDPDQDGLTNEEEYVQGTAPNNPDSPYSSGVFYVGTNGVDAAGHGTLALPWATIGYAMNQVNPGPTGGVRIILLPGDYAANVVLRPGVALAGELEGEARIIGQVTGAAGSVLEHLIFQAGQDVQYLLDMNDVAMRVTDVTFTGMGTETGILVDGANPLNSVIEQCTFTDLSVGIDIGQDIPAIRRNIFQDISNSAIIVRATLELLSGGSLGDVSDAAVGCNTFALSIAGPAVVNERDDTLKMEQNDWGTNDPDAITARIEGPADFEPFLAMGSGILAGSVYCTVWDANTQDQINTASVEVGTYGPVIQNIRGVYAFPAVPQGVYTTTTEAPGYQLDAQTVNVPAGQSASVLAALIPEAEGEGGGEGQTEGENEGEGETPDNCNCSNPQKTLPTKSELFLGALTVLTLLVSRRFYRMEE